MAAPLNGGHDDSRERVADDLLDGMERPWTTAVVLALLVAVHLVPAAIMLSRGRDVWTALAGARGPNLLVGMGAMSSERIMHGEAWRLVSAVFVHGDGLHLLVNAFALVSLGRVCEAAFGPARFLWLFVWSGIAGFALSWAAGNTLSVGASGGAFGLMGALVVFGWRYRHDLPTDIGRIFRRRILPWVVVNLVVGALLPFIDNLAHVGGLLCGVVMAMVLGNRIVPGEDSAAWLRGGMLLGALGLMAWAGVRAWLAWA